MAPSSMPGSEQRPRPSEGRRDEPLDPAVAEARAQARMKQAVQVNPRLRTVESRTDDNGWTGD